VRILASPFSLSLSFEIDPLLDLRAAWTYLKLSLG
jgi:hypothetical protein